MSISHTLTNSWQSGARLLTGSVTTTGSEEINLDFALAANATNTLESVVFAKDKLQSIFILSDQNITILTDSTTTPQDTLTVAAAVPISWNNQSGQVCPFTGDITSFYFSNANATAANISVRILVNA